MAASYWDCIKDDFAKVSIYDGEEVFASSVSKLPDYAGDLLATHWFLSEMLNGGIAQFFDNPTCVVAERAMSGFRKMDLPQVADAIEQAIRKLESAPEDWTSEIFEPEEKTIYAVGGSDLGKIYDRMDAYAKERS